MTYPKVLTEEQTIALALAGRSLARVGEGELRLALGIAIKSQLPNDKLAREMCELLAKGGNAAALVCLPRLWPGMPAEPFWRQFETRSAYARLYGPASAYGSAFVSRSDVANNIDVPSYWDAVRHIWRDKPVTLVARKDNVVDLSNAASVRFVPCPAINAYSVINRLEDEVGEPEGVVLLAAGPTATLLAERLARKTVHAIDIGHLGRFMEIAGVYSVERKALISEEYCESQRIMHKRPEGYGGSGQKSAAEVESFAKDVGAEGLLDYGCGQGTLKRALQNRGFQPWITEYDPAIKGKDGVPKPADLVTCTDVLEHIEPDKLTAVLSHLFTLARKAAFLLVATRPANKKLPDGRNAHLILEPPEWWLAKIQAAGFHTVRCEVNPGHDVRFWCRK